MAREKLSVLLDLLRRSLWPLLGGVEIFNQGQDPPSSYEIEIEGEVEDSILTQPAKEKFPYIEELLAEQSINIPQGWQVKDVLAVMAVGAAFQITNLDRRSDFDSVTPQVTFKVNLSDQELALVDFEIITGE